MRELYPALAGQRLPGCPVNRPARVIRRQQIKKNGARKHVLQLVRPAR